MAAITIGTQYTWNLLAVTAMCFQCALAGFSVGGARKKFGVDYPDMGSGRFTAKLTDAQWIEFNNVMRVHQNYVEQLPIVIVATLVSGIFYPTLSALLGGIYITGRYLYGVGYTKSGASGRYPGAPMLNLSMFLNLILCFIGIFNANF
ncbi:Microsomal glutathione S-transferase 3 [Smittium mucronatum]|uniref:Microsomal glutathione S-transferase 3 n=1 Tax=Smittium mucronatum TaxID=133383 RepID=A0A1R0GUI3_9FUNG|nr:Microsomal glutathione S-transferase 3 [Smittium mucronatum]